MDKPEGLTRREVMQSGALLAVAATLPMSAVGAQPDAPALLPIFIGWAATAASARPSCSGAFRGHAAHCREQLHFN